MFRKAGGRSLWKRVVFHFTGKSSIVRTYYVLGIETSCDDTCAAIVSSSGEIKAHTISSQFEVHKPYNGIVPHLAARAHENNIDHVLNNVFESSSLPIDHTTCNGQIKAIAVTSGPGLQPCLGVGIRKAKQLCEAWDVPIISIHHLEAHALVCRLPSLPKVDFPFLLLLVSGGHTQLIKCDNIGEYKILGSTLDDAVGEAFDKTARLLQIKPHNAFHPGELLEQLAKKGDASQVPLTIPLQKRKTSCEFSYSGLKTQIRRITEKDDFVMDNENARANLAAAFQETATKHLVQRVHNALNQTGLSTLVVAGGVAKNSFIRDSIKAISKEISYELDIVFPPLNYCTDNGVMVAWAGIERLEKNVVPVNGNDFDIQPCPRWKVEDTIKSLVT